MKLVFNSKDVSNPVKAFDIFSNKVTKCIKKKESIDLPSFSAELLGLGDVFVRQNKTDVMTKSSKKLAEQLVNYGCGNLAGIVYSLLIKLNKGNPRIVEELATNGLAVAKRFNDPVHIMARANDLRLIYENTAPKSDKMIKVLYQEKRALDDICKNYNGAKSRFQTLKKDMHPLENYEQMLCSIKIQIAQIIKDKEPKQAILELETANEIIKKYGKGKYTKEIDKLLAELKS